MGALAGVKVLDFTWFGVGPLTTKYLADNGAEVVKVESRSRLDGMRMSPPWVDARPDPNASQAFNDFNSSKRSITIDLSTEEGRDLARRLVPHFDVVTESFTPGTIGRLGLGYEDLRALRPDVIMLSTCMQGQNGPHADYPGFGNLMASLCGFYSVSGYSTADLAPPYGAYTDMIAHRFAACALLAAIAHRAETGEGQFIDLSQYEASLHFLAAPLVHYLADGVVAEPQGNRSTQHAPHGAYRCLDDDGERWVAIAVESDAQWDALVGVLVDHAGFGADAVGDLARFARRSDRLDATEELDELVQSWVAGRSASEVAAALDAVGVAAYPVRDALELHSDENLAAFDFWRWMGPDDGPVTPYQGPAYRLEGTPSHQTVAPMLGQHTRDVLRTYLDLDDETLDRLHDSGVCS